MAKVAAQMESYDAPVKGPLTSESSTSTFVLVRELVCSNSLHTRQHDMDMENGTASHRRLSHRF
jgi:hypothetical protein